MPFTQDVTEKTGRMRPFLATSFLLHIRLPMAQNTRVRLRFTRDVLEALTHLLAKKANRHKVKLEIPGLK